MSEPVMTSTGQDTRDPLALLGEIRERLAAAKAETWDVSERHGRDSADEGWSEVAIVIPDESLPLPPQVALTYLSGVIEPDNDEANTAFIVGAGKDIARLLAIPGALLEAHQPGPAVILGSLCGLHASYRHFSIDHTEAAHVQSCPACTATVYRTCTGCGGQTPLGRCQVRNIIAAALSGEETPS